MADRRVHRRVLIVLLASCAMWGAAPARAHDATWETSYRKWPWEAGTNVTLTTLPGECPHCPAEQSSSAWQAIDAALRYETVYSVAGGKVDAYVSDGGAAGKYLRIADDDGTFITYEHLSKSLVEVGKRVLPGQPIAVSGCTGNCNGAHLHFQRQKGRSFSSTALVLTPISGHWREDLRSEPFLSDNGGVAYSSSGAFLNSMRDAYDNAGGYDGWGITANNGPGWTPCRNGPVIGSWFRYHCAPKPGIEGAIQTYRYTPMTMKRALARATGSTKTYTLHTGILAAYTEKYFDQDWVYWLGYPTGNRRRMNDGRFMQPFENGEIWFDDSRCKQDMVVYGSVWQTYHFCE